MNAQGARRAADTVKFANINLFETGADALCNPVNCMGVMSSGLAAEFRERYPAMFPLYRSYCSQKMLKPGGVFTVRMRNGLTIFNVATKKHWSRSSEYQYVRDACVNLCTAIRKHMPFMVAVPALGCGLGGLSWKVVKEILLYGLQFSPRPIVVCNPIDEEEVLSADEAFSSPEDETVLPAEDAFLSPGALLIDAMSGRTEGTWWDVWLIGMKLLDVPGHRGLHFLGIVPGKYKAEAIAEARSKWPQFAGKMKIEQIPKRP
jgi:O-acetyl-ADP-ribose deacetylase (regulator of RNase III)